MKDVIRVGMADFKICCPPQKISTLGLGSCLGVVLYDSRTKMCGMAHIMLPDSRRITKESNRNKFVDTCLQDMYDELIRQSVNPKDLVAKIAGGASMFSFQSGNDMLNLGEQNADAVKKRLKKWNIPILAEDVGKSYSRTIQFDPETGKMLIRAVGVGQYVI